MHHTVKAELHCANNPCGETELGVDKGYSNVFVDLDGVRHGEYLGELLSNESDVLQVKYQHRNKLKSIIDKKPKKRKKILKNNLGRRKLNRRKVKHQAKVKTKIYSAVHTAVNQAKVIATEELKSVIKSKHRGKNTNRRLKGWVKGIMADALEQVSLRGGASLVVVKAAYTKQSCSQCDCLGDACGSDFVLRIGDTFYCTQCRVVMQADHNAARNVLARSHDKEIRITPFNVVKLSMEIEERRQETAILETGERNWMGMFCPHPIKNHHS